MTAAAASTQTANSANRLNIAAGHCLSTGAGPPTGGQKTKWPRRPLSRPPGPDPGVPARAASGPDRNRSGLAGSDSIDLFQRQHENLSVADLVSFRLGRLEDRADA